MNFPPSRNVLFYGDDQEEIDPRILRAGPLTLEYSAGDIRYIRLGDHEILRRIYAAVRDRNWGTVPPKVVSEEVITSAESFSIVLEIEHRAEGIHFVWRGRITGEADGTIVYTIEGVAKTTFQRNRIGFCVLHPVKECRGVSCRVEQADGNVLESQFPFYISPDAPFKEIRKMAHEVRSGLWAEIEFEGEIFETEDQRNWTDASFKTFCTPLRLPFPVEVAAGTRVQQKIVLRLSGSRPRVEDAADGPILVRIAESGTCTLCSIGFQASRVGGDLNLQEIRLLKALTPAFLRVEVTLAEPRWKDHLALQLAEAVALEAPVFLALGVSAFQKSDLESLARDLEKSGAAISHIFVFHENPKKAVEISHLESIREILKKFNAPVGSGTNAYFTQINRYRPALAEIDFLGYSINPQVHAFDNASLVENLAAQVDSIESTRAFAPKMPLMVGPITLRPQFNPDATGPGPRPRPGELPFAVDPRQMSLFGAGWTLGSIKAVAESCVKSAIYYETRGWKGVLETEAGNSAPDLFRAAPGMVFPLYHIFASLAGSASSVVRPSISSRPLEVESFASEQDGRLLVMLANYTNKTCQVEVSGVSEKLHVKMLDETTYMQATTDAENFLLERGSARQTANGSFPVTLLPFAVAFLES